jgi:MFS family permease
LSGAPADGGEPIFRSRPFALYWLARVFSAGGYLVQSVAVAWQIYELTGSALDLGLVGLIQFLPRVLLTPFVGNAADRYDRRRLMLGAQLVQAATMVVLTLACAFGAVSRELIFVLILVIGSARTLEWPASQALLPALVSAAALPRAVAVSASAMQAATVIAPAIGGLVYMLGATAAYALTTATFLIAVAATAAVRVAPRTVARAAGSSLELFREGIRFIVHQRAILGAMSLDLCAVLLGGATALLPIIAQEVLATGPWGLGLLRSAPAVGALITTVWLAHHPIERGVGRKMFACVAVFGVATIAFGLSHSLLLSMLILAVLGAADMVSVVIRNAYVQLRTPDAVRGRVSAVNSIFIGASNQLGEFESGLTAAWFGAVPAVVLGGVGTLLVVAVWMRLFPELLRTEKLEH